MRIDDARRRSYFKKNSRFLKAGVAQECCTAITPISMGEHLVYPLILRINLIGATMTQPQQPAGNAGSQPTPDKAIFGPYTIIPEVTLTDLDIRITYTVNDRQYDIGGRVADLGPHQEKAVQMAMFSRANGKPLLVWGNPATNKYGQQVFHISEMKFA